MGYQARVSSGNIDPRVIDIFNSALRARMHKPDENNKVQQETDKGFYERGGCKLGARNRYME